MQCVKSEGVEREGGRSEGRGRRGRGGGGKEEQEEEEEDMESSENDKSNLNFDIICHSTPSVLSLKKFLLGENFSNFVLIMCIYILYDAVNDLVAKHH